MFEEEFEKLFEKESWKIVDRSISGVQSQNKIMFPIM